MENVQQALEFLKKDWDELPSFIKACYLSTGFVLIAAWLIKDVNLRFDFSKHIFRASAYTLDFALVILLIFIAPLCYWLSVWLKILWYRDKYPIKKLGTDFHFRVIGDAVHIVDTKRKNIRWIESSKTAYDLGYYPSIWADMIQKKNYILNGNKVNLDEYKLLRGVRTRGRPGS